MTMSERVLRVYWPLDSDGFRFLFEESDGVEFGGNGTGKGYDFPFFWDTCTDRSAAF